MLNNRPLYPTSHLTRTQKETKDVAMADLGAFSSLVLPQYCFGHCHKDLMRYLMSEESNQLVLWPRAHLKSTLIAIWAAWKIINQPDVTILYVSATAELAELQLGLIKQILESPTVQKYWPGLINERIIDRTKWSEGKISVDHWLRKAEAIRDPSIKAIGINGTVTGQHYDVILLDDLVNDENSETKTERDKVSRKFSFLSSVINDAGITKAVGTRYHPQDLYDEMIDMTVDIFDEYGNVIATESLFTVTQAVVEENGQFLWPRQKRKDGRWFGFDFGVLATKKAKYNKNIAAFYSQYYQDPSDPETQRIGNFNYYDPEKLTYYQRRWYYGENNPLNVYAAIDFASTIRKKSDYTAIVVIGIDPRSTIYVLDLIRLKTDKISDMHKALEDAYIKWRWKKLRAETSGQQNLIVEQIKDNNKKIGLRYQVEKISPVTEKIVRIMNNLEPLYDAGEILHRRGGNWETLEHELSSEKPAHIDLADAEASAVEIAKPPVDMGCMNQATKNPLKFHSKFGGVA